MDKTQSDSTSNKCSVTLLDCHEVTNVDIPSTSANNLSRIRPAYCAVCGNKARCYNYDAIGCDGCRSFFRRMITKQSECICKADGRCDIKQDNRCRACRFNAYVLAGMNPKSMKFSNNFNLKQAVHAVETKRRVLLSNKETFPVQPKFIEASFCNEISHLMYLELTVKKIRESSYNPTWEFSEISEILRIPSKLADADKYSKPSDWPVDMDKLSSNLSKISLTEKFIKEDEKGPIKRQWLVTDFILSLEMAKILPIYQNLNENDKLILFKKVGLVNAILMQCFYSLKNNSNTILFPDGIMPIKMLFIVHKNFGVTHPSKLYIDTFCRSIETLHRIGINSNEYVLLKAIIFCYPAVQNLSEEAQKLLRKQQETYALILLRHLQARHGDIVGAKQYGDVIALIETFFYFAECYKQLHVIPFVEKEQANPLSIENLMRLYRASVSKILEKILF